MLSDAVTKKALKYKITKLPYDGAVFSFILVGSAKFAYCLEKIRTENQGLVQLHVLNFHEFNHFL